MISRWEQLEHQANEFDQQHPEVWGLFCRFTLEKISKGFKHYSAKSVMERIRWETALPQVDNNEFKINNNFASFYSRWFMDEHPEHEGFFRTRTQISHKRPPACGAQLRPSDFD